MASLEDLRIERRDEPRRSPWAGIAAAVALIALGAFAWWGLGPDTPRVRVAPALAAADGSGPAAVLDASGYVTARRQATVSSEVTGRVVEVAVEEGMVVEQGQVLARLDAANVQAAYDLAEAQAAAAESALDETRVRIEEARRELARQEGLASGGFNSEAERDRAASALAALEARLAAQRDELAVARRAVALRREEREDLLIRAPFSGVVVSKNAQPGEMISPISAGGGFTRTGICTLVDMDSLEIEVDVNEAYIDRVRAEQPIAATLDAYPEWSIPGHVIAIVPAADRQKATVRVRVAIDERDPRILPDMGVKVRFLEQAEAEASAAAPRVTVPRTALREDGGIDFVLVVDAGVVERRAVTVGGADGDRVEIVAGVRAGEQVVIEGPAELADGDRVEVVQ